MPPGFVPYVTPLSGLVAMVALIGLMVLPRWLARRAAKSAATFVSGDVPAVTTWVPEALESFARGHDGTSEWVEVTDRGALAGYEGTLSLAADELMAVVRLQPHAAREDVNRGSALRISVELAGYPPRRDLGRMIFGRTPTPAAFALQRQLCGEIRSAARQAGAVAHGSPPMRGKLVAMIFAFLLLVGGLGVITPIAIDRLAPPSTPTASTAPQQVPPKGSTPCTNKAKSKAKPARAAVVKPTSCTLAERVRTTYIKKSAKAAPAKLSVTDQGKKLNFTCSRKSALITCRDSKHTVYLY